MIQQQSAYSVPIVLSISYRTPLSRMDREDAQEELTDLIADNQETIALAIADIIGVEVEIEDVEKARLDSRIPT